MNLHKNEQNNEKGFFNKLKSFSLLGNFTIRKITFVGILIALAVVFYIVVVQIFPLVASNPGWKSSFIGLPIKISGFIFGPAIGGLVALCSDLISFLLLPGAYNPIYTMVAMVSGIVAGITGKLFLNVFKFMLSGDFRISNIDQKIYSISDKIRSLKLAFNENSKQIRKLEDQMIQLYLKRQSIMIKKNESMLVNFNLIIALILLITTIIAMIYIFGYLIPQDIIDRSIIPSRIGLIIIINSGFCSMSVFLVIARFKMSHHKYIIIVPIVIMSMWIELINVPLLAYADQSFASGIPDDILVYMFQYIIISPVKIWFNLLIIYYTYIIINPLITKNSKISY
ncbi:folate family ECF transporter S component [Mycoplasmopsis opalescens]|uniref:folate family ECF transporter S component n=1 Tax=Mycoplasmopsis opalescens TaxID=114886 RepID=UPI00068B5765|nr:folate family ECF transporter S component [Mycoplasmopsis opalescens]